MPEVLLHDGAAETGVREERVAPWPHTWFMVGVLFLWALYGLKAGAVAGALPHSIYYASHIVLECLLAGTTLAGLYRRRRFVLSLLGVVDVRGTLRDVAHGCLIYLLGTATMVAIWIMLKPLHVSYRPEVVRAMAPHTWAEMVVFAILSVAAGTCEEFVFRGYLLRQFQTWWRSTLLAVLASSLLFGCLHLYEGVGAAIEIGGLGVVYAVFAVRRGNLRSVVMAHFLQDALTGLLLFLRHR